jgi:hypothetical protein
MTTERYDNDDDQNKNCKSSSVWSWVFGSGSIIGLILVLLLWYWFKKNDNKNKFGNLIENYGNWLVVLILVNGVIPLSWFNVVILWLMAR